MESSPDAYARSFRESLAGWEEFVQSLTTEQFNRRPDRGGWSARQCLDHVIITAAGYLPVFEGAVARGGPRAEPPFRYDLRSRLFIETLSPGGRIRLRSPGVMAPSNAWLDPAASMASYRGHVERLLAVVDAARGLDLTSPRMHSPFLPRIPMLTFQFGALLEAVAGHDRRHFGQATRAVGLE
jgi:hypothetical protein